jgi:hypothetical protein
VASELFGWWKSGSFVVLAVILGLATWLVLPPVDPPEPVVAPLGIGFEPIADQQGRIEVKHLDYQEKHENGGVLLRILAEFSRMPVAQISPTMILTLPFETGEISTCEADKPATNPAGPLTCHLWHGLGVDGKRVALYITGPITGQNVGAADPSSIVAWVFLQNSRGEAWRETHSKVLINLPSCNSPIGELRLFSTVDMSAHYVIDDLPDLSWSGQPPSLLGQNKAEWKYTCSFPSTPPGPMTATKEGVEQKDSFQTFMAGAFFALAAAALIEALGEVVSWADRCRAFRRSRSETGDSAVGSLPAKG